MEGASFLGKNEREAVLLPFVPSDPGRTRTFNQQNRNLSFYPIELRGQDVNAAGAGREDSGAQCPSRIRMRIRATTPCTSAMASHSRRRR